MALVAVSLDNPQDIDRRMASVAIVNALVGIDADFVEKQGDFRRAGSGSGDDWAMLRLLPDNRAVLFGVDVEESEHMWKRDPNNPDCCAKWPNVDLVAEAPSWWEEAVDNWPDIAPISFLYAFDGATWSRAAYDTVDGFENVVIPITDAQATEAICDALDWALDETAPEIREVIEAGARVTELELRALVDAALAQDPDLAGDISINYEAALAMAADWRR